MLVFNFQWNSCLKLPETSVLLFWSSGVF